MKCTRRVLIAIPVAVVLSGQGLADIAAARQKFRGGATAVMVDVVVRDSSGKPVTDLRLEDFELREDGVRQAISDMTLVARPSRRPGREPQRSSEGAQQHSSESQAASEDDSISPPALSDRQFVALVFDRLSSEARALACEGALAYLDIAANDDVYGVFAIDLSVNTIQTFTSDKPTLRAAIASVATRATTTFDRDATRSTFDTTRGDAHPSVPDVASPESAGRPVDSGSTSRDRAMLATLVGKMSWEALARDQQGYATTNALMALSATLGRVPGRKTILFFAEGLAIPDAVLPHFNSVITTANAANVTIYPIDAAGLRVHSGDAETGRAVRAIGAAGLSVNSDGSNQSSLGLLELNEDILRKNPRTALTMLAERTGGFLVHDTNDLATGLEQIESDRRFHYLLLYEPRNTDFEGEWRRVEVRVPSRRGLRVRSREGYVALREPTRLPLHAYEGPALAALERPSAPEQIPYRVTVTSFPTAAHTWRVPVLVSLSKHAITFQSDGDQYRTDFTVLVRFKDSAADLVQKVSQRYRLTGKLAERDSVRSGDVVFLRQPELPPGRYGVEAVVHDALTGLAGVRRAYLVVPSSEPDGLEVSDLVLIDRAERIDTDDPDTDTTLVVDGVLLFPANSRPVKAGPDAQTTFLARAICGRSRELAARIELHRAGIAIAAGELDVPKPDADGAALLMGQIPLGTVPPGDYVVRLVVRSGSDTAIRESSLRVTSAE